MIDFHTHIGRLGKQPTMTLDASDLVRKMDAHSIEKSVVLPLHDSPAGWYLRCTTEDIIVETSRFPDRLVPFCQLDPRFGDNSPNTDFSIILDEYKSRGCKGVGEVIANMHYDDPLVINMMQHCGRARMPVVFHAAHRIGGTYGLVGDMHLPRLEAMIQACPHTVFCAHGPGFWSEISSNVDEATRGGYPKEPVEGPGRVSELLTRYPNLYGEMSASSALNALTRTPEFGYEFLEQFQDQLLFGTDTLRYSMDEWLTRVTSHFNEALAQGFISEVAYRKITHENAARLLEMHKLPPPVEDDGEEQEQNDLTIGG